MNLNLANSITALYNSLVGDSVAEKALELRLAIETDFSEPFYFFLFWASDQSILKQIFFCECLDAMQPRTYQPISAYGKCGDAVENFLSRQKADIKNIGIDGIRVVSLKRIDFLGGFDMSTSARYEKTKEGKMLLQ